MVCGWMRWLVSFSASRSSSEASTTTLVVPSPTSSSCTFDSSARRQQCTPRRRRPTDKHFCGRVVDTDAAQNGGAVVGDLDGARLAERLQNLVLQRASGARTCGRAANHALGSQRRLDQVADGNGADEGGLCTVGERGAEIAGAAPGARTRPSPPRHPCSLLPQLAAMPAGGGERAQRRRLAGSDTQSRPRQRSGGAVPATSRRSKPSCRRAGSCAPGVSVRGRCERMRTNFAELLRCGLILPNTRLRLLQHRLQQGGRGLVCGVDDDLMSLFCSSGG